MSFQLLLLSDSLVAVQVLSALDRNGTRGHGPGARQTAEAQGEAAAQELRERMPGRRILHL